MLGFLGMGAPEMYPSNLDFHGIYDAQFIVKCKSFKLYVSKEMGMNWAHYILVFSNDVIVESQCTYLYQDRLYITSHISRVKTI